MTRLILTAALALCLLTTAAPVAAQPQVGDAREFPGIDLSAFSRLENDLMARRAEAEPFTPEAVRWFLSSSQFDRALASATRIVEAGTLSDILASLRAVTTSASALLIGDARGYSSRLAEIASLATARASTMPAEEAARLTNAVGTVEFWIKLPPPSRSGTLQRDYPGTQAALEAELAALGNAAWQIADRLRAREAFAVRHAGTVLAARARFLNGFDLAHNGVERDRGGDPTPRFLEVVAIRDDLLSGRYPPCEWVDRAPELVSGFFTSRPEFGPDGPARMLAAYLDHLGLLVERASDNLTGGSTAAFVLWRQMGPLYDLQGEQLAGIESALAALEARATNKRIVRLFRAELFMANSFYGADRDELVARARSALEALVAENEGYPSRKALAVLASLELREGAYEAAIDYYQRYMVLYPESPWTWTARLRLGQAYEVLGNLDAAVTAYAETAEGAAGQPTASILGHSFAAWTLESMGRFDEALASFRQARQAWDVELGSRFFELTLTQTGPAERPSLITRPRIQGATRRPHCHTCPNHAS